MRDFIQCNGHQVVISAEYRVQKRRIHWEYVLWWAIPLNGGIKQ